MYCIVELHISTPSEKRSELMILLMPTANGPRTMATLFGSLHVSWKFFFLVERKSRVHDAAYLRFGLGTSIKVCT